MSDSLWPHESQHARLPCPSPTPGVYSNSCPSSRWCHPAILSSVVPFSSCPQSLPASRPFPMSQLFTWGGRSTGVSALASVLPMNTQNWSPLGWTGWILASPIINISHKSGTFARIDKLPLTHYYHLKSIVTAAFILSACDILMYTVVLNSVSFEHPSYISSTQCRLQNTRFLSLWDWS